MTRPAPMADGQDRLLDDCLALLHRFALEQTGWRGWLRRWYYSDELLRNDAANIVRRAGYAELLSDGTRLVGDESRARDAGGT